MYYPYFVTYIVAGLILSIGVFLWALKNGQFRDQKRARYLPLEEEVNRHPRGLSGVRRIELFALAGLVVAGLSMSAVVLVYSMIQNRPMP